jgi:hypothetical protein
MALKRTKALLIGLAVGAIPLVTMGSCDPVTGALDFFRDDDNYGYYYDDFFYGDYFYDDYYYYDPYYYDDYYYYDDCFWCW